MTMSRSPFNGTYRYVDLLLTITLLLIELILVMRLPSKEAVALSWKLEMASTVHVLLEQEGAIGEGRGLY